MTESACYLLTRKQSLVLVLKILKRLHDLKHAIISTAGEHYLKPLIEQGSNVGRYILR